MLIQFTYCIQLGINPVQPERKHLLKEAINFGGAGSFDNFGRKVEVLCMSEWSNLDKFPINIVHCIHLSRTKSIVSPFGHRTDSLTIVSLVVLMIMEQYYDIMFLDYYKSPSALSARA